MNKLVIFSLGVAVGAAATWFTIKSKYEQLSRDEIEAVKAVYMKKSEEVKAVSEPEPAVEKPILSNEKPNLMEYAHVLRKNGYDVAEKEDYMKKKKPCEEPYIIAPEHFDEYDDFDALSLTYYADKVLVDENDNVYDDEEIEETIGKESLTTFGTYEDDSVFVRNELLKIDYEILLDNQPYYDVVK